MNPGRFLKNTTYDLDFLESACDLVSVAPVSCAIEGFDLWRRVASYVMLACLCAPQEREYYFLDGERFNGFVDKIGSVSEDDLKKAAQVIESVFEQHTHILLIADDEGVSHSLNALRFIAYIPAEDEVMNYLLSKALIVTQSDSGFYTPKENFRLCVSPNVEEKNIVTL